jgi:hypothetical protein
VQDARPVPVDDPRPLARQDAPEVSVGAAHKQFEGLRVGGG